MIKNTDSKKKRKVPEYVIKAKEYLASIKNRPEALKSSEEAKIAEAKLTLAVYGCQTEHLPTTITNVIVVLGTDAADTIKYLTPEQYPYYGIIDDAKL